MSAFICSDKHINAIVHWASQNTVSVYHGNPSTRWPVTGQEQATSALLFAENVKSINHRYQETRPLTGIVFDASAPHLRAIEVLKACICLDYQSCEHPQWQSSLACTLLQAIQSEAITQLPGYDNAPWQIVA